MWRAVGLLSRLVSLTIMVTLLVTVSAQSKAARDDETVKLGNIRVPHAPPKTGCYHYAAAWQKIPCSSAAYVRSHVPKEQVLTLQEEPSGLGATGPLEWAHTSVVLQQFGGETDSREGANYWSLQLNTNSFPGPMGHPVFVQVGILATPGQPFLLCIESVDIVARNYDVQCAQGPNHPAAAAAGNVFAVRAGIVAAAPGLIELLVTFPGSPEAWSEVVPDKFGLSQNWTSAEGGIRGWGNASAAIFKNTCTVTTVDIAIAQAAVVAPASGGISIEGNNLVVANNPQASCLVPGLPGACEMQVKAQTSGETCFQPPPPPPAKPSCSASTSCTGEVSVSCTGQDVGVRFNGNCRDSYGEPTTCTAGFTGASTVSAGGNLQWLGSSTSANTVSACTEANGQFTCINVKAPLPKSCPPPPPNSNNPCGPGEVMCGRSNQCMPRAACLINPAKP